jgi:hypothetical protein
VQLFVLGLTSSCSLAGVLWQKPFVTTFKNRKVALVYSATLAHVIVTLGGTFNTDHIWSHPYFLILLALWCVLTLAIFLHRLMQCCMKVCHANGLEEDAAVELAIANWNKTHDSGSAQAKGDAEGARAAARKPQQSAAAEEDDECGAGELAADTLRVIVEESPAEALSPMITVRAVGSSSPADGVDREESVSRSQADHMLRLHYIQEDPNRSRAASVIPLPPLRNLPAAQGTGSNNEVVSPVNKDDGVADSTSPRKSHRPSVSGRGSAAASLPAAAEADGVGLASLSANRAAPSAMTINGEEHIVTARPFPAPVHVGAAITDADGGASLASPTGSLASPSAAMTVASPSTANGSSPAQPQARLHVAAGSSFLSPSEAAHAGAPRSRRNSHSQLGSSLQPAVDSTAAAAGSRRGSRLLLEPVPTAASVAAASSSASSASASVPHSSPSGPSVGRPTVSSRRNSASVADVSTLFPMVAASASAAGSAAHPTPDAREAGEMSLTVPGEMEDAQGEGKQ